MKITWLGQAGLMIQTEKATLMIDPYLSDSVTALDPLKYRRIPVDPCLFEKEPDLLLFTHNHIDHYDPETAACFLKKDYPKTVLGPTSVWSDIRRNGGNNNYVCFDVGTEWSERGLHIRAIRAVHSDSMAIGFVITEASSQKSIYITGDTLYNASIFPSLPKDLFAIFLPINGVGNNMNAEDAIRFAKVSEARFAVPLHFGMLDDLDAKIFTAPNAILPKIYEEIVFPQ